jgi:NADH:ubiquinone oxidoreductase subunit 5 (subunit L)/multisubunit Na+/H+ antiporter MnhA subunit
MESNTLIIDLIVMFIFLTPYTIMLFTLLGLIIYQRKKQKLNNNTRLFMMIMPILCLFIVTNILRIIDYQNGESEQQSLPIHEHSLRNRVSNGITLCLFMCIEYIIIGIFLYINHVFLKTCEKLSFISKRNANVLKINLLV